MPFVRYGRPSDFLVSMPTWMRLSAGALETIEDITMSAMLLEIDAAFMDDSVCFPFSRSISFLDHF